MGIFDSTVLTTNKLADFPMNKCNHILGARNIFLSNSFYLHLSFNHFPVKGHTHYTAKCVSIY